VQEKAKKNQLKHFDVDLEKVCSHNVLPLVTFFPISLTKPPNLPN
jgi:hypothetical protein